MIDEKGRLFGKLNIVDLLVILVVLVAVVVLGVKFLGKDGGGGINPGKTQVTYTVLVKGVEQESTTISRNTIPDPIELASRRDAGWPGGFCGAEGPRADRDGGYH